MMGDMGRARRRVQSSVPLSQVIPIDTDLPWEVLGDLPGDGVRLASSA